MLCVVHKAYYITHILNIDLLVLIQEKEMEKIKTRKYFKYWVWSLGKLIFSLL